MGNILHSGKTCAKIAIHLATEMKPIICKDIILDKKKISILVDESTTLSRKTTLVVVLRTFFETFPGEPCTFNLDLIELCSTSAEQITIALLECLNAYGFDQQFLKECLVCFACDGASVMIGKNSGVTARLVSKFNYLALLEPPLRACS